MFFDAIRQRFGRFITNSITVAHDSRFHTDFPAAKESQESFCTTIQIDVGLPEKFCQDV